MICATDTSSTQKENHAKNNSSFSGKFMVKAPGAHLYVALLVWRA